jgi:hypothetical protein
MASVASLLSSASSRTSIRIWRRLKRTLQSSRS